MRTILALILALPLFAVCPTDSGYTSTCFVSLTGNNTTGNGTIGNPYRTWNKALQIMGGASGQRMIVRGGRWTANADIKLADADLYNCVDRNCTIGGFAGEIVTVDGDGWTTGNNLMSSSGTVGASPPYNDYVRVNGWTFHNFRFENIPRQLIWMQAYHEDLHFKNILLHASIGPSIYNCVRCSMQSFTIDLEGHNPSTGQQGHALDITPAAPNWERYPWPAQGYAASGNDTYAGTPNYYQMVNVAPIDTAFTGVGGVDFLFDDFHVIKRLNSAYDAVGFEQGNRIRILNSTVDAQTYNRTTGNVGDSLDLKSFDVSMYNTRVTGGKNGCKAWGKFYLNGVICSNQVVETGETAMTFAGPFGTNSTAFPADAVFNPIHYAYTDGDGDATVVLTDMIPFGNAPLATQRIVIEDVPGCTSINKEVVVHPKGTHNGRHVSYPLQNLDGTQLACNAPYDFSTDIQETHVTTVTFTGGGSANFAMAANFTTCSNCTNGWGRGPELNYRAIFSTTGTLPTGLTPGTTYYIKSQSGTTLTITATPQAGTGGTAAITFSDTGSGTHTITIYNDHNSYKGTMRTPDSGSTLVDNYGAHVANSTFLTETATAMDISQETNLAGFGDRGFTYDFSGVIGYAKRTYTVSASQMYFGGPRIIANATDDYLYLPYHDATAMAVNEPVNIRCEAIPMNLGMPAPLTRDTQYYVKTSDASGKRIQVATSVGGSVVNITGSTSGKCWAIFPTLTTEYIEIELLSGDSYGTFAAGNTVTMESTFTTGNQLPYPFAPATSYTITDLSTVSVNGTDVYLMRVNTGGGNITHTTRTYGPHYMRRENTPSGTKNMMVRGGYTKRGAGTANNLYYTAGASGAHATRVNGDASYPGNIADTAELQTLEGSNSCIANPALDFTPARFGRFTASTNACANNKGFYNAFHKVVSKADTTAIIFNKFPNSCRFETCTLKVDNNSDLASPVETITITSGGREQFIAVGKTTPLTANTLYYYGWQQGYDTGGASFTTAATLSGTGSLVISLGAGDANASVAYGLTPSLGTAGDTDAGCTSGCTLTTTGIAKGTYYYQVTRGSVAGQIQLTVVK